MLTQKCIIIYIESANDRNELPRIAAVPSPVWRLNIGMVDNNKQKLIQIRKKLLKKYSRKTKW